MWLNGKYYNADDVGLCSKEENGCSKGVKDEKAVLEIYKLFNVTNPPRDAQGKLEKPDKMIDTVLYETPHDLKQLCMNDM